MKPVSLFPFPLPSFWDFSMGLLVIAVTMANYFTGKVQLFEVEPLVTILYGVLTPWALAFFRIHIPNALISLKRIAVAIAILFSQFVTIGHSFFYRHDWSLCFEDSLSLIIWALQSLCYCCVFYPIILGSFGLLRQQAPLTHEPYKFHIFQWFCALIIVRSLYLLLLYPCVFDIDAAIGLRTFLDPDSSICNHHPILVQSLQGLFFMLGKTMGYRSIGILLLSVFQIIVSSLIIIYGLNLVAKSCVGHKTIFVLGLFFILFPFYSFLSVFITKDGMFAYSFLFYIFTLYELYLSQGICLRQSRFLILHILSILVLCLTRHQGIYIAALEVPMLLYCYRQYWKRILVANLLPFSLLFLYSNVLLPYLNVEPAGKQEIYGTLFHQTANYLNRHPEDVSENEREAIFNILDRNSIIKDYTYNLTDGSKDCYKYNPMSTSRDEPIVFRHIDHSSEQTDLKAYRKAWSTMFLCHPFCCIQATLGVCFGFFYNNGDALVKMESYWNSVPFAITQDYIFGYYNKYEWIYHIVARRCAKMPVFSWLFAIPYYIWFAIIAVSLLLYRKEERSIAIFLPLILSIALLVICPYASGSYAFPIVTALPLLIFHLLSPNNKCQE